MMRTLALTAVLVSGLIASAPAAAQVYYNSSPGTPNAPAIPPPTVYDPAGPAYYNQSGAPLPGAPMVYDPAGPAYYNQSGAPIPGAPTVYDRGGLPIPSARVSPNPPYVAGPGGGMVSANPPHFNTQQRPGGRWGGSVNGRWWGGMQAPGGWGGYRRMSRGHHLPNYWMSANFRIPDYTRFGLRAPGNGYFWVRYYDDAVLTDYDGRVWDSMSGIAWADADAGDGWAYANSYASAGGAITPVDPNRYYAYPVGGYAPPVAVQPPAVHVQGYPGCPNVCQNGGGYYGGTGYYSGGGGYYYGGGTTTTIVIQPAPVVTTTTTTIEEVVEEQVVTTSTYVARPKRVVRRAHPRPKPRPCSCRCCR
jgi:Ni/Co efflux regulator RcnB